MEKVRQLVVAVCYTVASSVFWGYVAAAVVRYVFDIAPDIAMFVVALPVAVAFSVFIFPKVRRIIALQ